MSEPGAQRAQRAWRASCSACGAPVEFRSSASPMAVCSFCKSTLVRDGETLRRIGRSAELFDDHSPLSLGTRGTYGGEHFILLGRLQLAYKDEAGEEGRWTEWHALFDNGRSGCLSEDNGAYVFAFRLETLPADLPDFSRVPVGELVVLAQRPWSLTWRIQVHAHAAEGELDQVPQLGKSYALYELRNTAAEVMSVSMMPDGLRLDVGRTVLLSELALDGLPDRKQASEGKVQSRICECPNCGASVSVHLNNSKTVVCDSCKSVIDIRAGLGGDLASYQQENSLEPLIPLGRMGSLPFFGSTHIWQVVGYQERCEIIAGEEEEQIYWREYLLFNRVEGFIFLVDTDEGWSVVRVMAGVPGGKGKLVTWQHRQYKRRYTYTSKSTYVLGEFYWPVKRDQHMLHIDYATDDGRRILNREQSGSEVTWSEGEVLSAEEIIRGFQIPADQQAAFRRDVKPLSSMAGRWPFSLETTILILFFGSMLALVSCSDDCDDVRDTYGSSSYEYQQCSNNQSSGSFGSSGGSHGGSYGGYHSGGFHK